MPWQYTELDTRHGHREVSIRGITTAAGLGMGSVYTYFPGKEAVYGGVLDTIERRDLEEVEKRYLYPGLEKRSLRPTSLFTRIEEMTREILTEGTAAG